MPATDLAPDVAIARVDAGGALDVRIRGSLVTRNAFVVRRRVAEIVAERPRALALDLREVDSLDVAGLLAVTAPLMTARRHGTRVVAIAPRSPDARRVAAQAGVLDLLHVPGPVG